MNFIKRTIAAIMVIIIAFTMVPLDGLIDLDLSWLDLSIHASAEDIEEELPDNWIDYSSITPNQYMAKVLLNYNYIGTANDYGEKDITIPGDQMRWYTNASNMSAAAPLYNALNANAAFVSSVSLWKTVNFDPSEAYEELLDMEGYYEAILMSILDVQVNDNEFLEALNCSTNKTIMSLSKGTLKILEEMKEIDVNQIDLKNLELSHFTEAEFKEIYSYLLEQRETRNLYKQAGSYLSDGKMIFDTCTTVYDVIATLSKYAQLADFSDSVKNVLHRIYLSCPSSNTTMKSACKKV